MLKVRPGPDPYVFYKMHHVEEVAYRQDDVLRARVQLA